MIATFTLKLIVRFRIEGFSSQGVPADGTTEATRMIVTLLVDLHCLFGCKHFSAEFTEGFRQRTIGCRTTRHDRLRCLRDATEEKMEHIKNDDMTIFLFPLFFAEGYVLIAPHTLPYFLPFSLSLSPYRDILDRSSSSCYCFLVLSLSVTQK